MRSMEVRRALDSTARMAQKHPIPNYRTGAE